MVEESEETELTAATKLFSDLSEGFFKGFRLGLLHGKMKPAEKKAVMDSFSSGETQLLVSTTVIEVGIDVPNAVIMVIENAERFGLSQLHQLRGRVGRGQRKSFCVLVSGAEGKLGETARERLKTMCTSYNGFEIAEVDLKLRGPGDFLSLTGNSSIRQSGTLTFNLADMCEDSDLMQKAFASASGDFINK
jgi:ATP-dependent DNA helicase RecG